MKVALMENIFKVETLKKYSKYTKMFVKDTSLDLEKILPDHKLTLYKKDLKEYNKKIILLDKKHYLKRFELYSKLLEKLDNYNLDILTYKILLKKEKNETLISCLKSFNTSEKKARYKLSRTVTGRLINKKESPSILTLPKKYRNIFRSSWKENGSIVSLDFKSLEPRLAKRFTCKDDYKDLYETIGNLIEGEVLDRSVIKKAVISTLYGSKTSLNNLSQERTENLIKVCKDFFEYDKLYDLAKEVSEHGFRTNYFGRPLWNTVEERKNIIINNYIQSSAVDISLKYFSELVNEVDLEKCRPLFIIHDAIVFDVHNDYYEELVKIKDKGYNDDQLGFFPLTIENFTETNIDTTSF